MPFLPGMHLLPWDIAGFNVTGWAWLIMLAVTLGYFLVHPKVKFPIAYWVPWILYMFVFLLMDPSFLGLQLTLQYLLPVFIGAVASGLEYDDRSVEWFYRGLLIFSAVLLIIVISDHTVHIINNHQWAASAMVITIPAAILISKFFVTNSIKYLLFYGLLFLVPFLNITRMGILAFVVILFVYPGNGKILYKAMILVLGVLMLLMVFNSKSFQEKTFFEGQGELNEVSFNYYDDNSKFNTNGRSSFYQYFEKGLSESPIFGNGPRADYYVMNSFSELKEVHNDYLSIRYDYGYLGLSLLFIGIIGTMVKVYERYRYFKRQKMIVGIMLSSVVLTLFIPLLMFMYSDNILKYTIFFPDIYFTLIGLVFADNSKSEMI
jgi:hypothetical protein